MSNYTKELVLSSIIGINPTGILQFDGTYKMNGNNNIIQSTTSASKTNLTKIHKNEIICSTENFENYNQENILKPTYINFSIYNKSKYKKNLDYKFKYLLLFLILFLIIFFIFI